MLCLWLDLPESCRILALYPIVKCEGLFVDFLGWPLAFPVMYLHFSRYIHFKTIVIDVAGFCSQVFYYFGFPHTSPFFHMFSFVSFVLLVGPAPGSDALFATLLPFVQRPDPILAHWIPDTLSVAFRNTKSAKPSRETKDVCMIACPGKNF